MDTIATIATSAATTATVLAPLFAYAWRKSVQISRRMRAAEAAIDYHSAMYRGVVLVVSFAGSQSPCAGLLIDYDFTVRRVKADKGGRISTATRADLAAADVVIVEGLDAAENAALYDNADFMECLRSGVALVHLVPRRDVFYDQSRFRECDQSVTVPTTAVSAVFTAIHRLRVMQRRAGVDPGGLAAARAELLAAK